MLDPTLGKAQQGFIVVRDFISTSAAEIPELSGGAIAGISIAGSLLFVLLFVGPTIWCLIRRYNRRKAASSPASSISCAEFGQLTYSTNVDTPRRLRKKGGGASDRVTHLRAGDARSSDGYGGRSNGPSTLPPVFSRSYGVGTFPNDELEKEGAGGSKHRNDEDNRVLHRMGDDSTDGKQAPNRSPEKHRGHLISQNRRTGSWIDEDALHGPRITPRKHAQKKSNTWFRGNGLTRALSRHLSFRGHQAPELARSPTLPCTETIKEQQEVRNRTPQRSGIKGRGSTMIDEVVAREFVTEKQQQKLPSGQPAQQALVSPGISDVRDATTITEPEPLSGPGVAPHCLQCLGNNMSSDGAQLLANRARVSCADAEIDAREELHLPQSNSNAELNVMLQRTAEELQDGNRSARRQTLMSATPSSSVPRTPYQAWRKPYEELGRVPEHTSSLGDAILSPTTQSQKSAPAVMQYAEFEFPSPKAHQDILQGVEPWQTHKRSNAQRMSLVSMLSEADSLVAPPSRRGSQADILRTALSSPSRSVQMTPSFKQPVLVSQSYSPGSEQSSALSTVYSEDEDVPPVEAFPAENRPDGKGKTEEDQVSENLWMDGDSASRGAEIGGVGQGPQENFRVDNDPRPSHIQSLNTRQPVLNSKRGAESSAILCRDGVEQQTAETSPMVLPVSPHVFQPTTEDPFNMSKTPPHTTPHRLSQVFTPIPAGAVTPSAANETGEPPETPTPPPSRRRVLPPPHLLEPNTGPSFYWALYDSHPQIQLPSREPSLVLSEGGLSSVYESYRYSRYSDSFEGPRTLDRLSTGTMTSLPTSDALSMKITSDEDDMPMPSTISYTNNGQADNGESSSNVAQVQSKDVVPMAYTYPAAPPRTLPLPASSIATECTVQTTLRSQPTRDISLSAVSDLSAISVYSQDEDGHDRLAPLMPFHSTMTASGRPTRRVASTVAELRRMNSQLSCISGYSAATTTVAGDKEVMSPTLPALRGGGCSPGRKETGGAKNYLALGTHPLAKNGMAESRDMNNMHDTGSRQDHDEKAAPKKSGDDKLMRSSSKSSMKGTAFHKGGAGRPRRNTATESYEKDLDRARQVFRERGYSLKIFPEATARGSALGGQVAQAAK